MDDSSLDYRALFESSPGLLLVLRANPPTYTIVAASGAYLAATMTKRENILGKGVFEVFPDNPNDPKADGVSKLRSSLGRVLLLRMLDKMAVQKYDIQRPGGGGFEERFWSPANYPVFSTDGMIRHIIHRAEDVTEYVRLKRKDELESEVFLREKKVREAEQSLRNLIAFLSAHDLREPLRAIQLYASAHLEKESARAVSCAVAQAEKLADEFVQYAGLVAT